MTDTIIWIYWFILSPLLGLLIGSFLNVCIYRLPKKETIVKGHSYCPSCSHDLKAADLVPVLSFLFLKGKCRYCSEKISARYALVEIVSGLYAMLAVWRFRPSVLPDSEPLSGNQIAFISNPVYASLLLALSAVFCFYLLLVWAMIIKDRQDVPAKLFIWFIVPVSIRIILQPEVMLQNGFVFIIYLTGLCLLYIISRIVFRQKLLFQFSAPYVAGFGLMVLYGGSRALAALLITYAAGMSLTKIIDSKSLFRWSPAETKQSSVEYSNISAAIRSFLPAMSLLAASVWWFS